MSGGYSYHRRIFASFVLVALVALLAPAMYAQLAVDRGGEMPSPSLARNGLAAALGAGLLLAGGCGLLLASRLSKSLKETIEVAEAIGGGDFRRRLRRASSKEFDSLARAVNNMAERIEAHIRTITEQKGQMEAVLDGMREGVMVLDARGRIRSVNRALSGIFPGIGRQLGRRPLEAVMSPELQRACDQVLLGNGSESGPSSLQIEPGSDEVYDVNIVSLRNGESGLGAVVVFHDISRQSRLEKVRRDFVANVSHELRSPLTSVKGYAETLLSGVEGGSLPHERARAFLEVILKNANHMAKMVNDLLNLARLEDGGASFEMAAVDPAQAMALAWKECAHLAQAREARLENSLPGKGLAVVADLDRLAQVFRNLVENALTHGARGGLVEVLHERRGREVVFTVRDNGPGIPKDDQRRIFERFYRVEKHRAKTQGPSTGLGLAISKHIVEKMGGAIRVESPLTPDGGAAFHFSLATAERPEESSGNPVPVHGAAGQNGADRT